MTGNEIVISHDEIVEMAKKYIADNGISQNKFAGLVGIGGSTLSRWLAGDLENPATQDAAVYSFLGKEEQRKGIITVNRMAYVDTEVSKRIWNALDYSALTRCIGIVYGDAGVGKTTTLKEWYRHRKDAILIKADRVRGSRSKALLKLLARGLRTQDYGQLDDMYCAIVEKLRHEDRIIVVDEAQHLSLGNIELLRDIYDDSETAITLVGNEKLYNKIAADKGKDYAQLFSRIGIKEHVLTDDTTRNDVKRICVGVGDEGIDFLHSVARSAGGLRSAIIIYANASNNNDLSIGGLKAIASYSGKNL